MANIFVRILMNCFFSSSSNCITSSNGSVHVKIVVKISDTPFGKTITDLVSSQLELIEKYNIKLEKKRIKAIEELLKIEDYISGIQDIETRLIFTKRYIELKKWEVIAIEMNMCERAVFKRHSDYLKGEKNV